MVKQLLIRYDLFFYTYKITLSYVRFKVIPSKKDGIPSETEFTIEINADINEQNVWRLNKYQHLEDFLIIKCTGGNDLFVNIVCDYAPKIIGASLQGLSMISKEQSFESVNKNEFFNQIEDEIKSKEKILDQKFKRIIDKYQGKI